MLVSAAANGNVVQSGSPPENHFAKVSIIVLSIMMFVHNFVKCLPLFRFLASAASSNAAVQVIEVQVKIIKRTCGGTFFFVSSYNSDLQKNKTSEEKNK